MATLGRPRSFDRQEALSRASDVFWARGYEATSLADLQKAMGGISAPSFYAAFGSKEALFREVIERHASTEGVAPLRALTETAGARAAIAAFLTTAAELFSQPGKPRGCMLVLGSMNCSPESQGVQDWLAELRRSRHKKIRERLARGVTEGDVPASADLGALASFYVTVLDGLAIQARDGASRRSLKASVAYAMAAWDQVVATPTRPR